MSSKTIHCGQIKTIWKSHKIVFTGRKVILTNDDIHEVWSKMSFCSASRWFDGLISSTTLNCLHVCFDPQMFEVAALNNLLSTN